MSLCLVEVRHTPTGSPKSPLMTPLEGSTLHKLATPSNISLGLFYGYLFAFLRAALTIRPACCVGAGHRLRDAHIHFN